MSGTDERACLTCGHGNRAQARFCEACGKGLESGCATCGNELRSGARFCDACGAAVADAADGGSPPGHSRIIRPQRDLRANTPKHLAERILTARGAMEGERKQVTVLFADVKGSMELAEQVDPEEFYALLDRFFVILTEGVHRFEGTVNQYAGDGVMALFGAPLAHEDHAHRACYAALHLLEELRRFAQELKRTRGLPFAVRMGINSGEVVVGTIGDDLRMDYTAQGQVIGIAARLQTLADPGKAYLSERTADLVSGFFQLESLGRFTVKGVSQPLGVFSLEGAGRMRTRLDVSRAHGLSRFVGRADEMAVLETALARVHDGQAQVVGVVADAGTGKSRLCEEFADRCRDRAIAIRAGRGVAHGRFLAFHPLIELLQEVFGVSDRESPREAQQKIAGTLVLVDRRLEDSLGLFFDFLGVPDPERPAPVAEPADLQRQLFAAIARLLRALGEREPNVILLEDLHWFDDASAGFLDTLLQAIEGTKTLVLANFRPEFRAPWMERPTYQRLPLLPLGAAALTELLEDLVGRDPSLAGVRELVRERAGGNPFFVEEIVQSLVEAGALEGTRGAYRLVGELGRLRVPPTIQALLAARIDRLPEHARRLLQMAAVIGKRFSEALLQRVAGAADEEFAAGLRTLRQRDLVYEHALFPKLIYAFKHPLTQEVAYGSQLAENRRVAHAAVATVLEAKEESLREEYAALLAHHWEAAGQPLPASRWHARAAERAELSAPETATAHWRAIRRLGPDIGDSREGAALRLAACIGLVRAADYDGSTGNDTAATFAEGRELALEIGDHDARVRLLLAYSALALHSLDYEQSARLLAEAEAVAAETDDAQIRFVVRGHAGFVCVVRGETLKALELYEQAFALLGDVEPRDSFVLRRYMGGLANRWMMYAETGRLDEAAPQLERLLATAEAVSDLSYQCIAHFCFNRIGLYRGDPAAATRHARTAIDAAERLGVPGFRAGARVALGGALLLAGDAPAALAALEDAERVAPLENLAQSQRVTLFARMAEAHAILGRHESALRLSEEAVNLVGSLQRLPAADAYLSRARVLLAVPDTADAEIERTLDAATDVIRHCAAGVYEPAIHEERARLARRAGRLDEAERELEQAFRLYREIGASGHAARLAAAERTVSAA